MILGPRYRQTIIVRICIFLIHKDNDTHKDCVKHNTDDIPRHDVTSLTFQDVHPNFHSRYESNQ
jgi:hypothetical protein